VAASAKGVVQVQRRINAGASRIFGLLSDPRRHPEFDGSGMLRSAIDPVPIAGVGDAFLMQM
jgi:hypothetical protein